MWKKFILELMKCSILYIVYKMYGCIWFCILLLLCVYKLMILVFIYLSNININWVFIVY